VRELQLDLAGLLAERTGLVDERAQAQAKRWRGQLRQAAEGQSVGTSWAAVVGSYAIGLGEGGASASEGAEEQQRKELETALEHNRRSLHLTREAFLEGLPSTERAEAAAALWENAVLRAEVHANQQAMSLIAC
jgi:hypothetical protein